MTRKKNKKPLLSFRLLRNLTLSIFVIFLILVLYQSIMRELKASRHFKIREIVCDPTLQFLKSSRLASLKGKSIFEVNLSALQKQLQNQYPEISQLKLSRRFPAQIRVSAQKRIPFATIEINHKNYTVDPEGIILSQSWRDLPVITGLKPRREIIFPGQILKGYDLQSALKVLKAFKTNKYLSATQILRIDVESLSQIEVYIHIPGELKILVDQNNIAQKIQMLSLLLSQAKLKLEDVHYIDLRFREPIIGRKPVEK